MDSKLPWPSDRLEVCLARPPRGREWQHVGFVASSHHHLTEPAKRRFLAGLACLTQRLDDRLKIEEVVAGQRTLCHERPFQVAEHPDAEVVKYASVGIRLRA